MPMGDDAFAVMQRTLAERLGGEVPNWGELSNADLLAYASSQYADACLPMWDWVLELGRRLAVTVLEGEVAPALVSLDRALVEVADMEDPLAQTRRSHELINGYGVATVLLSKVRREAMVKVVETGVMDQSTLAEDLGITRSRVSHLMKAPPAGDPVTIDDILRPE